MKCPHCHIQCVLYRQINTSGVGVVVERCPQCRTAPDPKHPFISKNSVKDWGALPEFENYSLYSDPCFVCGKRGTELHHFSPRSIFGDECNDWPTAHLCIEHHREWHKRTGLALGGRKHD
jgi:hypothetical protein